MIRSASRIVPVWMLLGVLGASGCAKAQSPQLRAESADRSAGAPSAPAQEPIVALPHPALTKLGGDVSIADVTQRVLPSVVNISMTKITRMSAPNLPFFFGPFGGPEGMPREQEQHGLGSGVIVSKD